MSYQNQSNSDNLEIIVGPPGPEILINSINYYAPSNEATIDKAWSRCVEKIADHFMKPKANNTIDGRGKLINIRQFYKLHSEMVKLN